MQTEFNKKPDKTIEIKITLPWTEVKKNYEKVVEEAIKEVEVKGFRKGKAPRNLAEQKLDQEKVWQKMLEEIIPKTYSQIVQKENLRPIISPQIQLLKAAPENELVFKATTAEEPDVELGDYKKAIGDLKNSNKIWTPKSSGKFTKIEDLKKEVKKPKEEEKVNLNEILEKLIETIKITLPEIIVEQQTNRNLANLLDQVKELGMNMQQYAQAKNTTVEQFKKQSREEAEKTLKLEFILEKIANVEKIVIEDKEIDAFINNSQEEKERKALQNNRYYIASLLRRQKTLQKLLN